MVWWCVSVRDICSWRAGLWKKKRTTVAVMPRQSGQRPRLMQTWLLPTLVLPMLCLWPADNTPSPAPQACVRSERLGAKRPCYPFVRLLTKLLTFDIMPFIQGMEEHLCFPWKFLLTGLCAGYFWETFQGSCILVVFLWEVINLMPLCSFCQVAQIQCSFYPKKCILTRENVDSQDLVKFFFPF